jgi:hypothetical protein
MSVFQALQRAARPAVIAVLLAAASPVAQAQQQPSASSIQAAKQLIAVTGATTLFNPLITGVVEQAKLLYLQQNPALAKDLNEIAIQIRTDLQPRFSELTDEVARQYATRFTEQELKAILAFYQSPPGKKLLAGQQQVVEASMQFAQDWANKLSDLVIGRMRDELKRRGHQL